jgi:hypothetical protein
MTFLREGFHWLLRPTLAAHLVRGAVAAGLVAAGYMLLGSSPALGVAVMFSALIPLGGCPACCLGGTIGAACAYKPEQQTPPQA